MNSGRYNLIPKPILEINSLEGVVNAFPNAFELNCGFHLLSNFLVGIPIHNLNAPTNKLELVNLGTK